MQEITILFNEKSSCVNDDREICKHIQEWISLKKYCSSEIMKLVQEDLEIPLKSNILAVFYKYGIGTSLDYERARFCYEESVSCGDLFGTVMLGLFYEENVVGIKSNKKALELYQQAADACFPLGLYRLGKFYENFNGGYEKSVVFYEKAVEYGFPAEIYISDYYFNASLNWSYGCRKAFIWGKRAAVKGNMIGQHYLGSDYLDGNGTEIDIHNGIKWLCKAYKSGYMAAELGLCRVFRKSYY
ncbi:4333_t:CDS:1 [Ambispora gerdemannii]|uniref:4333_t:CDS:1 n=1 Tax=Ambispora gerdemannii TaxID=144530 RepID=A0A9N9DHL8_9GLOM|nr:4333_t:CDS:1 [Ambispora gerdemannii]